MDLPPRTDETFMRLALGEAATAAVRGEVPVGAIVVCGGRVIARAHNQVELLRDGTAHAEMLALTQAANALGQWRLTNAIVYVTKEPCAMCAGAMVNCRVGRLVYGVGDMRTGAAGGALDVTGFAGMLHRVPVVRGVLEAECLEQLQAFFQRRRQEADGGSADLAPESGAD